MNCKPGDLAFIVADDFPENIGRLVEVRGRGNYWPHDPRPHWHVEVIGSPLETWLSEDFEPTGRTGFEVEVEMPDADLRPIRPDGITEEEVRDLYQPAPAKETA